MKWPKVSIVTPSFNQGSFLEQTITSVLGQNYPDLEYIVMDGGSRDNSVDIIRRYADKIAYWVSEKDKGQSDAIVRGFQRCSGELIGWVNSDDVLYEGALRHLVEMYQVRPEASFVAGGSVLIDARGRLIKTWYGAPNFFWTRGALTHKRLLFRGARFLQPGTLWARELYESIGGLDTNLRTCMDWDMFLRMTRIRPAYGTRRIVAGYRMHEASKTCSWQPVFQQERKVLNERFGYYEYPAWQRTMLRLCYATGNRLNQALNSVFLVAGAFSVPKLPEGVPCPAVVAQ